MRLGNVSDKVSDRALTHAAFGWSIWLNNLMTYRPPPALNVQESKRCSTLSQMAPIPLSKVRTFGSYSGLYWLLCVEYRQCGRRSEITTDALARRFGRDALISGAVKRLICEKCKAKNPIVLVGMKG